MQNSSNLSTEHMQFMHATSKGWITIAQKDPQTNHFKQYHYTQEEIAEHLSEWTGVNIYFSQNTFFKPKRAIDTIQELRSLYVDVDTYTKGLNAEWVLGKLEFEYFGQSLPNPNMVLMSGRGLVIIWNIEPVPYMAMPLWKAVETHFIKILKDLGADPKASDPTRIFRLAGTINSKNGALVTAQYRHEYRYELRQLQYDYLPELTPPKKTEKKRPGRKSKVVNLFNIYTLHLSRAMDLRKIIELREGDVGNCRETMCFLYRYWTCCYSNDPEQAMAETIDLNSEFKYPLSENEVIKATKSAEKAWEAKSNTQADKIAKELGYAGAGYNLKNATIIDWLHITETEQKHMSTIIGKDEKRRRNTIAKRSQRRGQGVKPLNKELKIREEKTDQKLRTLKKHIAENPKITNTQLASRMNCTVRTIQRLKKRI